MPRKRLTDKQIENLRPTDKLQNIPDTDCQCLYVRLTPNGSKSFAVAVRDPQGKKVWRTLAKCDAMAIADARDLARLTIAKIRSGEADQPPPPRPATLADVSAEWLRRHIDARGVRTAYEIRRVLARYILPQLGERPFLEIRRGDIARMLDVIEDNHGARQADVALMIVRSVCNWYSTRHDDYTSPVVRGMRRAAPTRRERILDDDEIRRLWKATEAGGPFSGFVRLALLSAQRREKVLTMRWADLSGNVWTIPVAAREKGAGGELVLPPLAMRLIDAQPRIEGNCFVFAGRTDGPFNGMSRAKLALDKASGVTGWTPHDLRRTARSLMSRAGVAPHVAELVLGHVQPGIVAVYDRHSYRDEKADALARLAGTVSRIIDPAGGAVVALQRRA